MHRSGITNCFSINLRLFSYPSVKAYIIDVQKNHFDNYFEYPQHMFWQKKLQVYNCLLDKPASRDLQPTYMGESSKFPKS